MASFPVITARDYSIRQGLYALEQEPITVPRFEFQFTSDFDFYPLGKQDFIYLDPPYHQFATIRPDLASCLWETLKMKVRFILCAARNGNCDAATDLLTTFISSAKLRELNLLHPPFPPAHQLTSNPFLRPGHPAIVETWVTSWQTTSRMLTAWIARARENSARVSNSSWVWPSSPLSLSPTVDSNSESGSTDISSTTTELNSETESVPLEQAVLATHAHASLVPRKRVLDSDSSPIDSTRDGDDPSKKQMVLWQPTISQLLEAQQALSTGEVPTGHSVSSTPLAPPSSPSSSLDPRRRVHDPRLQTTSPAQARYTLADSIARLERLHKFVHGASAN